MTWREELGWPASLKAGPEGLVPTALPGSLPCQGQVRWLRKFPISSTGTDRLGGMSELPSLETLNTLGDGHLPGLIGIRFTRAEKGLLHSELKVRPELLAPNGFLHAASVIALADTTCGYGTRMLLPEGAAGFTTIELKSNHLGTAREGVITCEARVVHSGRTTQVWDAEVRGPTGKVMALFRCTQAVLYPQG